jgi:hypothetical protein
MIKLNNRYIFGTGDKVFADIDYIDVRLSSAYLPEDNPNHVPAYWHIVVKHTSNEATIKADGQTYQTEADALDALEQFITQFQA